MSLSASEVEEWDTTLRKLHKPEQDAPYSLVDWPYCSCHAMEVFVADDGYNSIGPARYPCPTIRAWNEHRERYGIGT